MNLNARKKCPRPGIDHLTSAQRDTLEQWLFEDKISYPVAARRCAKEFDVTTSRTACARFYQQVQRRRNISEILDNAKHANTVVKQLADNPSDTYKAIMNLVGQVAFNAATLSAAGEETSLDPLRKAISLYIDTRRDDRDADRVALEREKWEFDVARLCFEHHTELQAITADQSLDEDARLQAIRRRLFGSELPE